MLILSMIWWAGPHVGLKDPRLRCYLIAGTIALFCTVWLIRRWIVNRRSNRFKKDLDAQAKQDQSRESDIAELRNKMNEAIASLKSSELGSRYRGNAALYALPWFMIIGPSAAGKTSLLRNSGLNFPYAHDNDIDIRGYGGTRNCDWWFSNEAVLLDTAGRYTTEPEDHEEWLAFLSMLRKHRRRQPLTGAIVAISLPELLTANSHDIERHVKIIRDRIEELTSRLGCVFPIYIVFTKCDLLYGFSAYFADLDDTDREQVWGIWMGHNQDGNIAGAFRAKLNEMQQRLIEMRMHKLSMVRKVTTKGELFDFPSQFDAAKNHVATFISKLTEENPYQDTPNFCGIYMTSATQEGTPLQKIMGNMRQAFGYIDEDRSLATPEPKSFFVKNFFQNVVFPNSNAVSSTKKLGLIHRTLKTASVLTAIAIIAGCFFLLSTTLTFNTLLLKEGSDASTLLARETQPKNGSIYQNFQALTRTLDHYRTLVANEKQLPLSLTIGIYEGDKQLPAIRSLLLTGFGRSFYQPAVLGLETRLANYSKQWAVAAQEQQDEIRGPFYQILQSYLMLCQPDRLEPQYVIPVLQEIIQERLTWHLESNELTETERQDVAELLQLYLDHMLVSTTHPDYISPHQVSTPLVAETQDQLRTTPDASRLYARLLHMAAAASQEPLSLPAMLQGSGRGVLGSTHLQPFLFTHEGWRTYAQPQIKELANTASRGDWVTGYLQELTNTSGASPTVEKIDKELAAQLELEIRALYFADYTESWLQLLNTVQISSFTSLDDAAKKMLLLTQPDGPLTELMLLVSRNINIPQHDVQKVLTNDSSTPVQLVPELEASLHDLRKLTDPGDKMSISPLINQYLLALSSAQSEIEQLAAAVDVGQHSFQYSSNILAGNGATNSELYKCWLSTNNVLHVLNARTRMSVTQLLNKPIQEAWKTIIEQTRDHLQTQWVSSVIQDYKLKIAGKFPFSQNGSDASLSDVSDFFHPDEGVIWAFVSDQLKPFLQKKSNRWSENTWLGTGVNFGNSLMQSLSQASSISSGLFKRGQSQPDVRFSIYPVSSQGVRVVHFESNGQQIVYQNEPQEWKQFQWPGNQQTYSAMISATPSGDMMLAKLSYAGDWSLFHLLQDADISFENDVYHLKWDLQSAQNIHTVRLNLRPDRRSSIFDKELFSSFRLPSTIF